MRLSHNGGGRPGSYRDRHSAAGGKSGKGDAAVLASVLRTGIHAHRPLPADSELAQAVAVLARARLDAVLGPGAGAATSSALT